MITEVIIKKMITGVIIKKKMLKEWF